MTRDDTGIVARSVRLAGDAGHKALWHWRRMPERAVEHGLAPSATGFRWRRRETIEDYLNRHPDGGTRTVLSPAVVADNPLPANVHRRSDLSADGALWGYSMRDVPARTTAPTAIAELENCRVLAFETPDKRDYFPSIVAPDETAIELREISHRPGHAAMLARGEPAQSFDRATWLIERAYHNHSHWLTAHLPKVVLLKAMGAEGDIILPQRRTAVMDASLRALGIKPDRLRTFDGLRPIVVRQLTVLETDRFAPDLLQPVRSAFLEDGAHDAKRKVFISRARSRGRRITNEPELVALLESHGFETVLMEDLDFKGQVALMQRTRILVAPHGAGITNMIFAPPGGHVVELADPGFPNPNFYALACAMDLRYWLLHARAGDAKHALDRDLTVDVGAVAKVLERIG